MDKLIFKYTFDDFYKANMIHKIKNKKFRIVASLMFLFLIVAVYMAVKNINNIFAWIVIAYVMFYFSTTFIVHRSRVKKYFEKQPALQSEQEVILYEDKIFIKNSQEESYIKKIHDLYVNEKFIIIYNTPVTFYVIPRRVCVDNNQFHHIADLAAELRS